MSHGKLDHAGKRISRDPETIRCSRSVHMNDAEFAIFLQAVKLSGMDRGKFVVRAAQDYVTGYELHQAKARYELRLQLGEPLEK